MYAYLFSTTGGLLNCVYEYCTLLGWCCSQTTTGGVDVSGGVALQWLSQAASILVCCECGIFGRICSCRMQVVLLQKLQSS